jgi:hypothetical protein
MILSYLLNEHRSMTDIQLMGRQNEGINRGKDPVRYGQVVA